MRNSVDPVDKSVLVLFNAYRSHEISGFHYAYVKFTPELVQKLNARIRLLELVRRNDDQAYSLEFWHYAATFLSGLPDGFEQLEEELNNNDWVVVTDPNLTEEKLEAKVDPTECNTLIVRKDDVYWEAIVKHGDVRVETRAIDFADAERLLA